MDRTSARPRDDLSPTLLDRLTGLATPGRVGDPRVRRIAAAALGLVAVALAVRGDPGTDRVPIVTVTRDLAPGSVLAGGDVRLSPTVEGSVPSGALRTAGDAVGHTLAGPARSGEVLTDVRLLGSRLAEAAAGPDARTVPLRIDDPELAALVRVGDRVDVLTVDGEGSTTPRLLAASATVVLVAPSADTRSRRGPVILVALGEAAATQLAAASLSSALTVTIH